MLTYCIWKIPYAQYAKTERKTEGKKKERETAETNEIYEDR
jgi:hypothetical protein